MIMKVVLFNSSPRKEGNTYSCLNIVIDELKKEGIECEYIWIGSENLKGCTACGSCAENKDRKCVLKGDNMNEYIKKMIEADGIILGTPTYYANVTANMKALMERSAEVCLASGNLLKRKVGAGVIAVRRGGGAHVFSSLNYFFLISQMVVVGSSYWNLGYGKLPGEVMDDEEGIQTFKTLGQNFAYVLKKMNA
jgi:multimeric flavodoxin WrbA